jgi:hypothetical protein
MPLLNKMKTNKKPLLIIEVKASFYLFLNSIFSSILSFKNNASYYTKKRIHT